MRKLILIIAIIFYNLTAFSQDSLKLSLPDENFFKAGKHRFLTELNINPFKGELSLNNTLNQVKVRYFTSDLIALRLAFASDIKSQTIDNSNAYGISPYTSTQKKKTSTIGISMGVERHFKGTRRLSPYVGAEFALAIKSSSHETENISGVSKSQRDIKGAWESFTYAGNNYISAYTERAFTRVGLNVLSGFDFYIAKNFYFGYELNLGFSNTKSKDIDLSSSSNGGRPTKDTMDGQEKEFSFGPNLINGIRLGFVF